MNDTATLTTKPGPKERELPKNKTRQTGPRTLSQFPLKLRPDVTLAIQKYIIPDKHYRLIWTTGNSFWFCAEDAKRYRKRYGEGGIAEAGKTLAEKLEVKFKE